VRALHDVVKVDPVRRDPAVWMLDVSATGARVGHPPAGD
jgi:hypothetical protein